MAENTTHTSNDTHYFNEAEFKGFQELIRESVLTDPSGGMYVIDEFSNAVHNGNAYVVNGSGTLATGVTAAFLGRTGDKEVHFDHFGIDVSKGLMEIIMYEAPTTTADGTPATILNRKRNSTNTSSMSVFTSPTVTDNGTLLEDKVIYDTGGVGSHTSQGSGSVDEDWILAPNTDYLITVTNNDTTSTDFSSHFTWAERDVI